MLNDGITADFNHSTLYIKPLRIGIVTYNFSPNVGACIQAYALKYVLERMGHKVNHILKDPTIRNDRHQLFADFCDKHLDFVPPSDDFDLIICGSDQVWSKVKTFDGYYFANFAKQSVIASYAASLSRSDLNQLGLRLFFEKNLREFSFISIREPKFKDTIEEITRTEVSVHIDPSLLLDDIHYLPFVKPRHIDEDYACIHYHSFGHKAPALQVLAKKIQENEDFSIAHNLIDVDLDNIALDYGKLGAEDVISTIYHSSFVITNSFYGLALSIIFKKDFLVVLFGGLQDGVNERIYNLCTLMGLTNRIVDLTTSEKLVCDDIDINKYKNYTTPINWVAVGRRLYEERKRSFDYLYKVTEDTRRARRDYLSNEDTFSCYGCAACQAKCPTNAITMVQDSEGFYYPNVDNSNCVVCGQCLYVCPFNTKKPISSSPVDCYPESNDGVFAAMSEAIIASGGAVAGVMFDSNFTAVYDIVDTLEECEKVRYSKYVEAADNDIYKKTRAVLNTGRSVLFTGTPCKIAGLINYLGSPYNNLLLADITCSGTCSPLVLRKHLEEKSSDKGLTQFQFLAQNADDAEQSVACEYIYDDGTEEIVHNDKDLFMKFYTNGLTLKRSCYACEWCKNDRQDPIEIPFPRGVLFDWINDGETLTKVFKKSIKGM